ncbi:hypothetical protein CORC01_04401, partial [Colletotrichum orchidophilum]
FLSVVFADEVTCCASGDDPAIGLGDFEWAIAYRANELGIPADFKPTYTWTTSINDDGHSRPAIVLHAPFYKSLISYFSWSLQRTINMPVSWMIPSRSVCFSFEIFLLTYLYRLCAS